MLCKGGKEGAEKNSAFRGKKKSKGRKKSKKIRPYPTLKKGRDCHSSGERGHVLSSGFEFLESGDGENVNSTYWGGACRDPGGGSGGLPPTNSLKTNEDKPIRASQIIPKGGRSPRKRRKEKRKRDSNNSVN